MSDGKKTHPLSLSWSGLSSFMTRRLAEANRARRFSGPVVNEVLKGLRSPCLGFTVNWMFPGTFAPGTLGHSLGSFRVPSVYSLKGPRLQVSRGQSCSFFSSSLISLSLSLSIHLLTLPMTRHTRIGPHFIFMITYYLKNLSAGIGYYYEKLLSIFYIFLGLTYMYPQYVP